MEEKRRQREVQLCELSVRAEMAREHAISLNKDREDLLSEILQLSKDEEREDEESASLSLQLKATMAKVRNFQNI